jgi:AcrR family transcriptional regulator
MGVKERQEREREAVSRSILDAARDLFVAEGYNNVSIRKIAERIEYSPAAIYSYFPSKDDIFFALAEEGFRLLCSREVFEQVEPLNAIRRPFWRVYEFSKTHPEYFALMFLDRKVPKLTKDRDRFAFVRDMRDRVAAAIQHGIDTGLFPAGTHPDAVFRILLTVTVGAATARLCDRTAPGEDADALAHDALEAALAGLRTGIPLTFRPLSCDDVEQS